MLTFERTHNADLIRYVLTHPKLYPHITDDGAPDAAHYAPVMSRSIWYVEVKDGTELLGLFVLAPQNYVTYEIHTALLPSSWGARAAEAAQGVVEWLFAQLPHCDRIVTNVPSYNGLARRLAVRAGMQQYGVNPQSFSKDGFLYDQILLGLSRPSRCVSLGGSC